MSCIVQSGGFEETNGPFFSKNDVTRFVTRGDDPGLESAEMCYHNPVLLYLGISVGVAVGKLI